MIPAVLAILTAGLLLGAMALLPQALAGRSNLQDRLREYATIPEVSLARDRRHSRARWVRLRLRLNVMLSALASESLNMQLARANWRLSVQEFLLARAGLGVLGFLLGWALAGSPISGAGLAIIAHTLPALALRRGIARRQTQFSKQLGDVLSLINGAVRAGHSLLQAMEVVVREMKPPASEEFGRVVREVGLGLRLTDALRNLAGRMQNGELDLVVTSIDIQYQVGGNMATMLDAVTETIRDRIRLFGEIRVLTTQQRYTSYLLSVLPVFVGGLLFLMNPDYMSRLFDPDPVWLRCIPIGAVLGVILGHIVIQRIIKIDV